MPRIPLASGAYDAPTPGLPDRLCENAYLEKSRTTPDGPAQIVTRWGSLALDNWSGTLRGMKECFLGGVPRIIAVIGTEIALYTPSTGLFSTVTGSITGSDRVVIEFTETEVGILGGGVFHVGDLTGIAAATDVDFATLLSDHGETAFINLMSIGQRFILQYGSRFCFTAVLDGDNTTAINYYTAEYAPDGLVGGTTVGLRMWHMGQKTGEPWEETGDSDDPFRRSLGQELQVGLRARDSFKVVDGSPYWVDQHSQVRRQGNAVVPDTLSGPDVSRMLAGTDADDIIGMVLEFDGHAMYAPRTPTMCPLYDANYGEWVRYLTNESDTWRYGHALRVSGDIYLSDADGTGFAKMHPDYKSDHMPDASTMGTEIVVRVSGYVLTDKVRPMKPLRIEGSKGIGLSTGQGSDPQIMMRTSKKGPNQFTPYRSRTAGAQGEYATRIIYNQMGLVHPPGMAIELSWSDPVGQIITGVYEDA